MKFTAAYALFLLGASPSVCRAMHRHEEFEAADSENRRDELAEQQPTFSSQRFLGGRSNLDFQKFQGTTDNAEAMQGLLLNLARTNQRLAEAEFAANYESRRRALSGADGMVESDAQPVHTLDSMDDGTEQVAAERWQPDLTLSARARQQAFLEAIEAHRKPKLEGPISHDALFVREARDVVPIVHQDTQMLERTPAQFYPRGRDFQQVSMQEKQTQQLKFNLQATPPSRPQSAGVADVVHFGLYGKMFFGTNLRKHEFTIDNVMTLQWSDLRVISMVPSGQDLITLSDDEAKAKIWLPEVEITNKVAREFNLISSSITIAKDGTVTKVERSLAVLKNKFALEDYPFDEQKLRLSIASGKYMARELTLTPFSGQSFSGLRDGFFDDEPYEKTDFSVAAFQDVDGSLKKSRGYMQITVTRKLARYQENFVLPAIFYAGAASAVFLLPFNSSFIVPRMALSVLVLLVFSYLAENAHRELPEGAPYNWIDLFCLTVYLHMFVVFCFNIFLEVAFHSMHCKATAHRMNHELIFLSPVVFGVAMLVMCIGSTTEGLQIARVIVPVVFALFFATYIVCCSFTLKAERGKNTRPSIVKETDDYGGEAKFQFKPFDTSESLAPRSQGYVS